MMKTQFGENEIEQLAKYEMKESTPIQIEAFQALSHNWNVTKCKFNCKC